MDNEGLFVIDKEIVSKVADEIIERVYRRRKEMLQEQKDRVAKRGWFMNLMLQKDEERWEEWKYWGHEMLYTADKLRGACELCPQPFVSLSTSEANFINEHGKAQK